MLQEAHSLTQESQRQRDHYHDDELTNLSVPVSTSSSSHDSPPDDAVYGPVVASLSWAIRNIEAEINKKLSEYWIVTAPVTPPTAVTDNVCAGVWASSRHNNPQNSDARVTRTRCQQPLPVESGHIQYHCGVAAPLRPTVVPSFMQQFLFELLSVDGSFPAEPCWGL